MVFAMIVVGGMTRLTHSGLSIVEWQPIVGAIPPLDDSQWEETFAKYRETPEYRLRNHDMTLEGFKGIFWWEYAHRLLGRVLELVFFLPFAWFVARRRIPRRLAWPLAGIFARSDLEPELIDEAEDAIRASVEYAFANPEASRDYVRSLSKEMSDEVCAAHIALYVNEHSVDIGDEGLTAIERLLGRATAAA